MEVRYQDEAKGISLTGYADTLITDSQNNRLVGIRLGGYPEVIAGLTAAICGGGTITVRAADGVIVCTPEAGHYRKAAIREGAYAVASIQWISEPERHAKQKNNTEGNESKEEKEQSDTNTAPPRTHYLLCAAGDKDALYREIDRASTIPMIPQFADYLIDELQSCGSLTRCAVCTTSEPFEAWRLICTPQDGNIASVITGGLKSGAIRIPDTKPGQPDAFQDITGVSGYLNRFGSVIAACIRGQFRPLYDPETEPLSDAVLSLKPLCGADGRLFPVRRAARRGGSAPAQAANSQVRPAYRGMRVWQEQGRQSGPFRRISSKSIGNACTLCSAPPTWTGKWVRELHETIPDSLSPLSCGRQRTLIGSMQSMPAVSARFSRCCPRRPRGTAICAARQSIGTHAVRVLPARTAAASSRWNFWTAARRRW